MVSSTSSHSHERAGGVHLGATIRLNTGAVMLKRQCLAKRALRVLIANLVDRCNVKKWESNRIHNHIQQQMDCTGSFDALCCRSRHCSRLDRPLSATERKVVVITLHAEQHIWYMAIWPQIATNILHCELKQIGVQQRSAGCYFSCYAHSSSTIARHTH